MERLSDTERKVLRILFNRNGHSLVTIDPPYYAQLAGREEGQVRVALERLAERGHITWDPVFRWAQIVNMPTTPVPIRERKSTGGVIPLWEWD